MNKIKEEIENQIKTDYRSGAFERQENWRKKKQELLKEIEKELQDFRANCKRLEEINSPIQIVDTSKNFFIEKIRPLLEK